VSGEFSEEFALANRLLHPSGMNKHEFVIPLDAVPGVYNYCNRWCQRCRFTARCTVFVNGHPDSPEARTAVPFEPIPDPALMAELEKAGAFDEPTAAEMRDYERRARTLEARVNAEPAMRLVKGYALAAEIALGELGDGAHPGLEVVHHYQHFVTAKVYRALHGMHDEFFDPLDMEGDAYGTAKAALIAMDELMDAWLAIGGGPKAIAEIAEAVDLLGKTRAALEAALPRAREFVRPGFDTRSAAVVVGFTRSRTIGEWTR
jgi:hypothetical protein